SRRALLGVLVSTARCQFVRLRLVVDSRTNPADGNGQETLTVELLRRIASSMPAETQVFNSTDTVPTEKTFATAKSGLPSPLKSPTATKAGRLPAAYLTGVCRLPSPLPKSTATLPLRIARAR